jgi:hypothetical protein
MQRLLSSVMVRSCLVLAFLFLLLLLVSRGFIAIHKPPPPPERYQAAQIIIRGLIVPEERGALPWNSREMAGLKLSFHFLEIPLDMTRSADDVALTGSGAFEARFSFFCRKLPSYCSLVVRGRERYEEKIPQIFLSGDPLRGTAPKIILRKTGRKGGERR